MILGFHCIISNYGFWLPNEPRGSWSEFVASWELFRYGPATKVQTHRSVAHCSYDHNLKRQMQRALKYDPARFTGEQARIVGMSLQRLPYPIHALAIMPNHTHLVIGRTSREIRRAVGHIKSEATRALRESGFFSDHSPWADHGWNVYLDSADDLARAIRYVQDNPFKDGLPKQNWNCVIPAGEILLPS
jgi:REP element-mobilizing transposase RayT